MIIAVVTFRLPKPLTVAEATAIFQSTAPKYQGLAGLVRKNYLLSEDGTRAGGAYLWETRADAERVYNADWKKKRSRRNMAHRRPLNISNRR
jgi:hypothetical protein